MNSITFIVAIIFGIIGLFTLYKIFKPYFIKYDTTVLFTGGLGTGKSLESVKTAIVCIRKLRFFKYTLPNLGEKKIKRPIKYFINYLKAKRKKEYLKNTWKIRKNKHAYNNYIYEYYNKHFIKIKKGKSKHKKIYEYKKLQPKPFLYSNIPVHFKTSMFSRKREWAHVLKPKHVFLIEEIREYSVCLIDEFPQFINQFEWGNDIIQKNGNEFITFYRQYLGSNLILNAQSEADIVVQFRRKLNQAIWCKNFKKHLFGLFYTNEMCDIMLSDNVSTMATTQIEENTKKHFGLFPPRGTYDSRCYSIRYKNVLRKNTKEQELHNALKTTRILRAMEYVSPLDSDTTEKQKLAMEKDIEKLERK